ncbi:MAG: efflux RND transporter periplasmic adaptor subunit [Candidatus Cybelea sp.]
MSKRFWTATAIGALAAALILAIAIVRRERQEPASVATPTVAVETARYGDYAVVLDETGYVGAPAGTTTELAFPNPGILRRLDVHVGDHVVAGELLASLDTRAFGLDAAQARAEAAAAAAGYRGGSVPSAAVSAARDRVRAARERVSADQAAVYRAQRLYAAGVNALKDVEAARALLAADQAAVATAESDLRTAGSQPAVIAAQVRAANARADSAELSLSQATLTAPTSGFITAVFHRAGEAVDSAKPVLAIGPPQDEVTLNVPGTDAAHIAVGNPVALRVAESQRDSRGHVSAIVPAVNPATQTATVVVAGGSAGSVAGTAVRARIVVAHVRGLLIPQSAVVADPQRGVDVVFVQQRRPDGSIAFVQRIVHVAHEDGTTADIASGVKPGERVASEGAFQLLAPSGSE